MIWYNKEQNYEVYSGMAQLLIVDEFSLRVRFEAETNNYRFMTSLIRYTHAPGYLYENPRIDRFSPLNFLR